MTSTADALPVLAALRERGMRTALLSNVGIDVRGVLDRSGLGAHLDGVVLSYQHGSAKPDAQVFRAALGLVLRVVGA